jgi:hypothetical protein
MSTGRISSGRMSSGRMRRHLGSIQGISVRSRRHKSIAALCRSVFVTAAQRSSWFPDEPHRKQRNAFRPTLTEKTRLLGDAEPWIGHGPRNWSPRASQATKPISSRTSFIKTFFRTAWKSTPGKTFLLKAVPRSVVARSQTETEKRNP